MEYVLTLNKISRSDSGIVGFRAVDLSEIHNKNISVPISFVIKNSLFEDFLDNNNLRPHIESILQKVDVNSENSLHEAHEKIKDIIQQIDLSNLMVEELMESYETLAIDMDHIDIAKLVTTIEKPYLTIIGSFNYIDDHENNSSVFHNIKGKVGLLKAIKECWCSIYSPKAIKYRQIADIDTKPKVGIIVQRMVESKISMQTYSRDDDILVKTFFGFQDYLGDVGKDEHIFGRENLDLRNTKVNFQEFAVARDIQSNSMTRKTIRDEADKQKLNDKDCEEAARFTKKIEHIIEQPVKGFMAYNKGKISLLFVNRLVKMNEEELNEEQKDVVEKDVPLPSLDEAEDSLINDSANEELDSDKEVEINNTNSNDSDEPHKVNLDEDLAFLEEIEKFEKDSPKTDLNASDNSDWAKPAPQKSLESDSKNDLSDYSNQDDSIEETTIQDKQEGQSDEPSWAKPDPQAQVEKEHIPQTIQEQQEPVMQEQPKQEEAVKQEPTEQIVQQEQPKQEEPVKQEPTKQTTQEQPKQEEPVQQEPTEQTTQEQPIVNEETQSNKVVSAPEAKEVLSEAPEDELIQAEDENDDFIFSNVDKIDETLKNSEVQSTDTNTFEEKSEESKHLEKAINHVKEVIRSSDDAINSAILKKHKEVMGTDAQSVDEAINNLKNSVRIPFIPEIKKIHKLREKLESGEEVEAEEAGIALRTAKNFLTIFS